MESKPTERTEIGVFLNPSGRGLFLYSTNGNGYVAADSETDEPVLLAACRGDAIAALKPLGFTYYERMD